MKLRAFIKILTILLVLFAGYAIWYYLRYSMDYAPEFALNDPISQQKILVATQGSDFKNELTLTVVSDTALSSCFFKVIDVSRLIEVDVTSWDAILLIHTWENWEAPAVVSTFVQKNIASKNLIVYTTSGSGDSTFSNFDGITGASIMENVSGDTEKIVAELLAIIQATE